MLLPSSVINIDRVLVLFWFWQVDELYEAYCIQRRLQDGANKMKQAFATSPASKAARESLSEINRSYKEYTEVCASLLGCWTPPVLTWLNCQEPQGFPGGASGNEPTCQCRRCKRHGLDPWVGKIPRKRQWQPTLVFLPGEFHGQRSLVGYSPWCCKESDTTERRSHNKAFVGNKRQWVLQAIAVWCPKQV